MSTLIDCERHGTWPSGVAERGCCCLPTALASFSLARFLRDMKPCCFRVAIVPLSLGACGWQWDATTKNTRDTGRYRNVVERFKKPAFSSTSTVCSTRDSRGISSLCPALLAFGYARRGWHQQSLRGGCWLVSLAMVLFLIGLGLGNEDDITEAGLAAVKACALVFLEAYTSVLGVDRERLELKYGKKIVSAEVHDRVVRCP
jgi:hypothetical protein